MGQREPLRMAADGAGRAPPRRSHPAPRWAAWRTSRPAAWRPPAQRRRLQPALLAAMPLVPVCGDSCAAGMLHSLHPAKPPVEAAAASICCRKCFSQLVANALPVPFVALQPGELAGRQHGYGRVWWGGRAGRAPWTCATRRARGPWPRAAWGQSPGRSARSGPGTTQTAPAPPPRRGHSRVRRACRPQVLHVTPPPGTRCVLPREPAGLLGGLRRACRSLWPCLLRMSPTSSCSSERGMISCAYRLRHLRKSWYASRLRTLRRARAPLASAPHRSAQRRARRACQLRVLVPSSADAPTCFRHRRLAAPEQSQGRMRLQQSHPLASLEQPQRPKTTQQPLGRT